MTHLKGERGYSLVETLAVVAVLAALMAFISLFSNLNQNRIESTLHNSCKQLAQASLDNLRSTGFEKSTAPGEVENNRINFSSLPAQSIPPLVNSADLLADGTTIPLMQQTGPTYALNNFRTIVGTMSVLSAIYNRNVNYCSNPLGQNYPGGTAKLLADGNDQNLRNVSSSIRIQRYNVATGARDCPPPPIFFRPPGDIPNDPALSDVVSRPANVHEDYGMLVTVTTRYTDPSNLERTCQMSSIFQYPRVRTPTQVNAVDANFTITPTAPAACAPAMPEGVLTLQAYENFDRVHGISILCRDRSVYVASGSGLPAAANALCPGEAGATGIGVTPRSDWQECHQVTACGISPSATNNWARPSGAPATLINRYANIPWGCSPTIEVRLIDPALNTTAAPAIASALPADSVFRQCIACPVTWTGPGYCPPAALTDGCTPPDPGGGGPGGPGGGDGGGPADGGDGSGGGTDGADG